MLIVAAGKGGVGKTTLIATLARLLQNQGRDFVVVDADPVGSIGGLLGLSGNGPAQSIAQAIGEEELTGLTDAQLNALLVPLPGGGKLLRMGYPRRDGCFCRVNTLVKAALARVMQWYPLTLMDSEAGVEHITRGTSSRATRLVLVADESKASLEVARSILSTHALLLRPGQGPTQSIAHLVVRTSAAAGSRMHERLQQTSHAMGLPQPYLIPVSETIAQAQKEGTPLPSFSDTNAFYAAVQAWSRAEQIFTPAGSAEFVK